MGVCLGTESQPLYADTTQRRHRIRRQQQQGQQVNGMKQKNGSIRTNGEVKRSGHFETPQVPVVFVIGGPGSGKITHSESLVQERKGFIHINMIDTLMQLAGSHDEKDMALLPTDLVTSTVMTALKNKRNVSGFIISGYPRNMRDVTDYLEKIGRCDGVILLNWQDKTLARQIEYGAEVGAIDLDMAQRELSNFRLQAIPVAEYFDYKQLLYVVSGERRPQAIYTDFVKAFDQILESDVKLIGPRPHSSGSYRNYRINIREDGDDLDNLDRNVEPIFENGTERGPMVIWIVGGPGSNKTSRLEEIIHLYPSWRIVSVGKLMWQYLQDKAPEDLDQLEEATQDLPEEVKTSLMIKRAMKDGEFGPKNFILDLIKTELDEHKATHDGFFITGFPRDVVQAQAFEDEVRVQPPCVLIDCSEMELGKSLGQREGRIDDNTNAYRRRLELYRELTLPLLKSLDLEGRLRIVDGDSEPSQVTKELRRCIHREVVSLRRERVVEPISEDEDLGAAAEDGYKAVDAVPEPGGDHQGSKRVVRYYDGVNPEVQAELQKVIDEMNERNGVTQTEVVVNADVS